MEEAEALRRACFWLCALIEAFGVEPEDTTIKASIAGSSDALVDINLADDLKVFQALGVNISVMDGFEREDEYQ